MNINPYAAGYKSFFFFQNDAENLKNGRNPGTLVLIWEYSARAIQWIPTWQGLDDFQGSLRPFILDESSLRLVEGLNLNSKSFQVIPLT